MRIWLKDFFGELGGFFQHCWARLKRVWLHFIRDYPPVFQWAVILPLLTLIAVLIITALYQPHISVPERPDGAPVEPERFVDLTQPVREIPKRFRMNTTLPKKGEGEASVSIGRVPFLPDHDLVMVHDDRVWWESEHDRNDTEDDHVMHKAVEEPFRRLVELVEQAGGVLKVQDAYRDEGIHAKKSLHKEGRALDLTSEKISLEKLAALTWAAGFDWVYYEAPKRGGHHIHASVRPGPGLARSPSRPTLAYREEPVPDA